MDLLTDISATIAWEKTTASINEKGYALIPNVLSADTCNELSLLYEQPEHFRKTVVMERHRFGKGEYKYLDYPLPDKLQQLREEVYRNLVPLANDWMSKLKLETRFPDTHEQLLQICREKGQHKATVLILKYGRNGYNTLHQDLYGEVYFPFQAVLFLKEPGADYTGGEFVITEQVPRAQSKAIVLQPGMGNMLIFTTNFRPVKSIKGYYRANMRHGVSEVHDGVRISLGIIFHDAAT